MPQAFRVHLFPRDFFAAASRPTVPNPAGRVPGFVPLGTKGWTFSPGLPIAGIMTAPKDRNDRFEVDLVYGNRRPYRKEVVMGARPPQKKTVTPLKTVEIFSDGACSGNPGPGGYGAILRYGSRTKEISGCDPNTTNNRMEMRAVIEALRQLKRPCRIRIVTDSNYIVKGMTVWIHGWIRRNWINSQEKPVLNRDLWEELLQLSRPHRITWEWIKGHRGHPENERCDELARKAIRGCQRT